MDMAVGFVVGWVGGFFGSFLFFPNSCGCRAQWVGAMMVGLYFIITDRIEFVVEWSGVQRARSTYKHSIASAALVTYTFC